PRRPEARAAAYRVRPRRRDRRARRVRHAAARAVRPPPAGGASVARPRVDLDALVADTLALCAVSAPTGAEERRAAEVARRLRDVGLAPVHDDAGNVLVRFGGDGPAAVVSAHLDTVFPEDVPLRPTRDDDVLRGPGIGDDTVAVATLLQLAALLRDDAPGAPVLLAFTVGEQGLVDLRGIRA